MRKKLFPVACAAVLAMSAHQRADANVYAAELAAVNTGGNAYDISFRLNEDATAGVTVRIKNSSDVVVRTIAAGNLLKGANTVAWDGTDDSSSPVPSDTYTFEVEAAATGHTGWTKISDETTNEAINFFSAKGIAINTDQTSPLFGRVYIAENAGDIAETTVRDTTVDGIFVLSNDLTDITAQGTAGYDGGVAWDTSTSSPAGLELHEGKLYISDWSDAHAGIWVMDESDLSAPATELFADAPDANGVRNNGTDDYAGSIYDFSIVGSGASTALFTMDEDITVGTATPGSLLRYDIGTAVSGYNTVPTPVVDESAITPGFVGGAYNPVPDGSGGWWLNQYRYTQSAANPCVVHVDSLGNVDFTSDTLTGSTAAERMDRHYGAGLAFSPDGTRMYVGGYGFVTEFDISSGPASPTYVGTIATTGNSNRDIEVDAAGNVYVMNNSVEYMYVFSPGGANSFVTEAPTGVSMSVTASVSDWNLNGY
ncbi:MAG: hypothetical protein PWP23_2218 [Candidatus Sumerlaeota bacterium]|nr:hypothetical protein [Candidatus Sumerlaeota bacterium]